LGQLHNEERSTGYLKLLQSPILAYIPGLL
jgi:hypothetical protein